MKNERVKRLVTAALLVALEIILSRFLSISTATLKIGFGFVPVALLAMLYGPWYAGLGAAAAEFLGSMLFPIGPYFPGFTLTALLTGLVYGFCLYNKEKRLVRITLAAAIVCLILNLFLDTLWLYMLGSGSFAALMPMRLLKAGLMLPIQVLVIWLIGKDDRYKRLLSQ